MSTRKERLQALQSATRDYVKAETRRLQNEADFLEAVLKGRTGGEGVQQIGTAVVEAVASKDLAAYLKGA